LVQAYDKLYLNSEKTAGKIFNIGGGKDNVLSVNKLITYLKESNIIKLEPSKEDWRPGDQKIYISNISKIEKLTNWKPLIDPKTGVDKLIKWCQNNNQLFKIYN